MALKLSLKPSEQFVVNGAVITNGDRRATLIIQNKVSILRERDIMKEAEANTPAKRVYFLCMLAYMDGARVADYYQAFVERMNEFMSAIENPRIKLICVQVSLDMMNREYYRALVGCRKLIEYEAEVLGVADVAGSVSSNAEDRRVA